MAGKPPADAAQPFGINGIIVAVIMNVAHEPTAPRIPNPLFQNPKNKCKPNNHSETPRNQLAHRTPKTGYIQKDKRTIADVRNQHLRLVLEPLLIPKEQEYDYHRCTNQVVIKIFLEQAGLSQDIYDRVHSLAPLLVLGLRTPRPLLHPARPRNE
jgi:hypothetical protein